MESYLQNGIDRGLSAYTLATQRAALCKLYGCTAQDFAVTLPHRERRDIERSRKEAARDYGFPKRTTRMFLLLQKQSVCAAVQPE